MYKSSIARLGNWDLDCLNKSTHAAGFHTQDHGNDLYVYDARCFYPFQAAAKTDFYYYSRPVKDPISGTDDTVQYICKRIIVNSSEIHSPFKEMMNELKKEENFHENHSDDKGKTNTGTGVNGSKTENKTSGSGGGVSGDQTRSEPQTGLKSGDPSASEPSKTQGQNSTAKSSANSVKSEGSNAQGSNSNSTSAGQVRLSSFLTFQRTRF
jgi:hypothetical protein